MKKVLLARLVICLGLALALGGLIETAEAQSAPRTQSTKADPRAELVKRMPGSKLEDFRTTPLPGIYEYARGADIVYLSADGKFAFDGDLYELGTEKNLSEQRRREARLGMLAEVPESQMVIFGPKDAKQTKHTITVFTDIDCGYCRKLHTEMAQYNDLGIRVRYLFYPRTGPETESWQKAESVVCAANRNDAMTRAKRGETVRSNKCKTAVVQRDFELGQEMGLRGTPALLLADGELVSGYVPAAMLIRRLEQPAR
jgi:thiol:disulfide interchange protein DsbC